VPRKQIETLSNDIGFFWDGTEYSALVSEYDLRCRPTLVKQLQRHYVELYIPKLALQLGGEVVQKTTQGTVTTTRFAVPQLQVKR